jgi:hypothetical protein
MTGARRRVQGFWPSRVRTTTGTTWTPATAPTPFAINQAWLTVTMIAVDLLAFAQTLLLHDTDSSGRNQDAALSTAARRRPARPRTTPALAAHRPPLALGHPLRCGVRAARRTARPDWLTPSPDPTNTELPAEQHAGSTTTPTAGDPEEQDQEDDSEINYQGRESPGLGRVIAGVPSSSQADHVL